MGIFNFFRNWQTRRRYARMMSGATPIFSQFGDNIYASDVVEQAVSCIVNELKKLTPKHIQQVGNDIKPINGSIQNVLDNPNPIMTTSELIERVSYQLLSNYNAFIFPEFDNSHTLKALYPIEPKQVDFLEDVQGSLFVRLTFGNGYVYELPYSSLIHLRYHFSSNEFMGGNAKGQPDHSALLKTLELNNTLLNSVSIAMKSSLAINGIVKYNTLMDGDKMDKALEDFERRLKNNESGFLGLDLKGEFIPFNKNIKLVDKDTLEFIDSKILRQFGVPLPILTGDFTADQMAAFYQKTLEPMIVQLCQSFTRGILTEAQRLQGNKIQFYPEELIFMNMTQRLEMGRMLGDRGAIYENELRNVFGLRPLPELVGIRMQSLNYVNVEIANKYQLKDTGEKNEEQ